MRDLISRETAKLTLKNYGLNQYMLERMERWIDAQPAVDAVADRPQGEWKRRLVDNGFNADWVCSECGYRVKTDFVSFNYCPNCGAQMKGADDE